MENTKLHAYIIASPSKEQCMEKAELLAMTILCKNPRDGVPCKSCNHCKKAAARIHPDIIYISREKDSSGKERQGLTVAQMRAMISDAQIMPNEAEKKVYIIPDGDRMNLEGQNTVLKLLEEPPKSASFILCAQNLEALLPTVRSRCATVRINAEGESKSGESMSLAHQFLSYATENNSPDLMRFFAVNENMDTDGCAEFIDSLITMSSERLITDDTSDRKRMMTILNMAKKIQKYLKYNVNTKNALGMLCTRNYE